MLDFIHNDLEFSNLLAIVSANLSVDITLVEKDYWIMHALYSLQQQNIEFELKGGTSLSKGYGLIHRFSEDIDIHIRTNFGLAIEGKEDKLIPISENSAFLLNDNEMNMSFEKKYKATAKLYYKGQPPFSEVLERIHQFLPLL